MRKILVISLGLLLIGLGCNKESTSKVTPNTSFIDTVSTQRYYGSDILLPQYSGIYNKWKLTHVTGGLIGGEHRLGFDFLIFKKNGIYCLVKNDSIKEFGKISISDQYKEGLLIDLQPDKLSETFVGDFEKFVDLSHKDTLILKAPCCDRYNFELVIQK